MQQLDRDRLQFHAGHMRGALPDGVHDIDSAADSDDQNAGRGLEEVGRAQQVGPQHLQGLRSVVLINVAPVVGVVLDVQDFGCQPRVFF